MLLNPDIKKKVLVVDDESGVRQVVEMIMRRAGYEVHSVDNGEDGLRLFRQSSWDAVIIDRGMPEMNGEELGEAIKSSSPDMPVIITTGMLCAVVSPQHFDAILEKPFRPVDLLDCVSRTVQKHEAELLAHDHLV